MTIKINSFPAFPFLVLLIIVAHTPVSASVPLDNQLQNHPSPYLALHGNDPIAWQDWSEQVVKHAKQESKLIFISSGYFSCHWCHVMQRESFSERHLAEQLDKLAIAVKIDRELQPALDAWLIDFTERTTGHAGWPLNVFLTPDGYPLVGMTYLPQENFLNVITRLQQRWAEDEDGLREIAINAFNAMKPEQQTYSTQLPQTGMDALLMRAQIQQALSRADNISGGFGDQNKFPMTPILLSLLESQRRFPNEEMAGFLTLTFDQMANLGLRDHIGGGFYRYTVDPSWDIPHFEKMLYDNAMLSKAYLQAADILDRPHYRDTAYETLDFLIREMQSDNGGFHASLSAVDDKGIEGGYYLWQLSELETLLTGDELTVAGQIWGVRGAPYLEAGHHLKQVASPAEISNETGLQPAEVKKRLTSAQQKLLKVRQNRILPIDTKVLAAWNGLMLESLSMAAGQDSRYRPYAARLYRLLAEQLWDGEQLWRFIHNGKPAGRVSLQDYAYVAAGMVAWAEASGDDIAWETANRIATAALQRFHNKHGWQLSEKLIIPYDARELILAEGAMPSPSATLLRSLIRIARHRKDGRQISRLARMTDIENSVLITAPLWYGTHLNLISETIEAMNP